MAKQKFSLIQVPSDVVQQDERCLVIQMRPHRRELIQKYVLSTSPEASVTFSSEEIKQNPCRLKVEKEKHKLREDTSVQLQQGFEAQSSATSMIQTDVMQIQTLKDFEFSVGKDEIKGSCRVINPNRYEVSLEVRRRPLPSLPAGLPPGTVIVLATPSPDQELLVLKTQIFISSGERVNIGEVIKKLKDNDKSIEVTPDLKLNTVQEEETEKVYLSLQ